MKKAKWMWVVAILIATTTVGFLRAQEQPVTVTITNFTFSPAVVTIQKGQTVRWVNQDSTQHTATADDEAEDGAALFDTDAINGFGGAAEKKFEQAGTFPYHCGFHNGMKATVIVQE